MDINIKPYQVNIISKAYGALLADVLEQVKKNQFKVYTRTDIKLGDQKVQLSFLKGYQKLNPNTIPNWNVPPYVGNPSYVVAGFKVKFNGNTVGTFNITVADLECDMKADQTENFDRLSLPLANLLNKFKM